MASQKNKHIGSTLESFFEEMGETKAVSRLTKKKLKREYLIHKLVVILTRPKKLPVRELAEQLVDAVLTP